MVLEVVALGAIIELGELVDYKEYRRETEYLRKKAYSREVSAATKPQRRGIRGSFWKPVSLEFTVKHPSRFKRHKFTASRAPRPDGYGPTPIKIMLNEYGGLSGEADEPSISALEFVDLSDGCRIGLRDGRGWGADWALNTSTSQWAIANGRNQANSAILILDPDDDDDWERWIIEELHKADIEVDPASVHAAPYRVEFGPRLQDMLRQPKR